ncbi:hypothetical protein BU24DRAFT_202635 [Aaosphaeria arxii CBS 175.79]|uniref:Uncharacterized protein n=1 Tax=Aaosphaeria arxii CBS 175.79 TaxID=1450172 RepID=A0A6A5XU89_9PLEO|nr:uncharacterized protein BU24DRAFT_202635 [Aaosphaeria arxii CBS 175.79]KAF2016486.1 hypothetical protein BU24DRAFT_202635 [Aaosphaeria arxii CBS 175.79]
MFPKFFSTICQVLKANWAWAPRPFNFATVLPSSAPAAMAETAGYHPLVHGFIDLLPDADELCIPEYHHVGIDVHLEADEPKDIDLLPEENEEGVDDVFLDALEYSTPTLTESHIEDLEDLEDMEEYLARIDEPEDIDEYMAQYDKAKGDDLVLEEEEPEDIDMYLEKAEAIEARAKDLDDWVNVDPVPPQPRYHTKASSKPRFEYNVPVDQSALTAALSEELQWSHRPEAKAVRKQPKPQQKTSHSDLERKWSAAANTTAPSMSARATKRYELIVTRPTDPNTQHPTLTNGPRRPTSYTYGTSAARRSYKHIQATSAALSAWWKPSAPSMKKRTVQACVDLGPINTLRFDDTETCFVGRDATMADIY